MRATRAEIINYLADCIGSLYSVKECRRIARMVAAHLSQESEMRYLTEPNQEIEIPHIQKVANQLRAGRPVQYVIGQADFCGLSFGVKEGVLIPRPETEELVGWAANKAKEFASPRILDLCTGSGCIALTLKHLFPQAKITAVDLSPEAILIAQQNATELCLEVEFIQDDVLQGLQSLGEREFDIIVSNPPYIPLSERASMHINVIDFEPEMALFVEDDNPLIFYRAIAEWSHKHLHSEGSLLFEIHETLSGSTLQMLLSAGYQAELREDFLSKPRMICCQRRG